MQDNIYTLDCPTVLIRVTQKGFNAFNQNNEVNFQELKELLDGKELECYFLKTAEEEYKIIVPVLEGQLELICHIHSHTEHFKTYYSYQAIVEQRKKTIFRPMLKLPSDVLRETVQIKLCDERDALAEPTEELKTLIQQVAALPIHQAIDVEQHQAIWFKWVEAQNAILKHLQKPYAVINYDFKPIFKEKDKKEPIRYQLTFNLKQQTISDYQRLEKELKKHDIQEKFDADGCILLKRDDLERVLDVILQRDFADTIERKAQLSAILKIKNRLDMEINQRFKALNWNVKAEIDPDSNLLMLFNGSSTKPITIPKEVIEAYSLVRTGLIGLYYTKKATGKTEKQVFHAPLDAGIYGWRLEQQKEDCKQDLMDKQAAAFQEGCVSARFELGELYSFDASKFNSDAFDASFWADLKRDFILYEGILMCNEEKSTISIDFESFERCEEIVSFLIKLNKFRFHYAPIHSDFKFKVKTQLIDRKTEQDLFLEQLQTLRGAECCVEIPKKDSKRKELFYLGKLDARESNVKQLVLNLPNIFNDDQQKNKLILKYLKDNPTIQAIQANLTGDIAKMGWLQNALQKMTEPTEAPNGKAVNPRLGDFLFDTAKATPIYNEYKIAENSEFYWDIRHNELLKLNDSQRKAVLAAVHCTDLALLQGPPGTGKTTVIAEMIWQMLRKNPKHRILLTSETNLAVDNAIDRLLNTKGVNPELVRFTTLIKPLRFGKMGKMDEEGAKYSVERILKWCGTETTIENIEPDLLGEWNDENEEDVQKNSPDNNAVRDWMMRIASRARHQDTKYSAVLKDWTFDLAQPTQPVKQIFKDKYFEYSNVVGSTCSSSGNPRFLWDVESLNRNIDGQKKLHYSSQNAPFGRDFDTALNQLTLPANQKTKFLERIKAYHNDLNKLKNCFKKEGDSVILVDETTLQTLETVHKSRIRSEEDKNKLLSYQNLTDFGKKHIAPYFEPQLKFDTVIMDEASKATPPELLLPLSFGKRCIVIGDHRQLPPMLNDKDFKEKLNEIGATDLVDEIDRAFTDTSQFERMILNPKISPTLIARCNIQYRMHPAINNVIQQFSLDEGGLTPAPELMKNADNTDLNHLFSRHHGLYSEGFMDPNIHTIWVNVRTPETREGTSVTNEGEAQIIRKVIELLKNAEGFEAFQKHWEHVKDPFKRKQEQEIGIISFYGGQKRLLKRHLKGCGVPLKINTVDRFQGMERNIIIVSTVRSHEQTVGEKRVRPNSESGFAKSPQRLNVALSRARRLLIVVGNKSFFEQVKDVSGKPLYKNAILEIQKSGKIIEAKSLIS
jgi:hypothetical protein